MARASVNGAGERHSAPWTAPWRRGAVRGAELQLFFLTARRAHTTLQRFPWTPATADPNNNPKKTEAYMRAW